MNIINKIISFKHIFPLNFKDWRRKDNKITFFWRELMRISKVLEINTLLLAFGCFCLSICLYRSDYIKFMRPLRSNILDPFGSLIDQNGYRSLALLFFLIWVIANILKRHKYPNLYILITLITFIVELWRTPSFEFIDIFNRINWKWLLIAACMVILFKDINNIFRTIKRYKPFKYSSHDSSKGFTGLTDDEKMIDNGWENYSNVLISRLENTDLSQENFAIGITGSWGTGKTTFLKTFKNSMDNHFIIVDFEAWQSNSPAMLIKDFFHCLSSTLGASGSKLDVSRYLKVLKDYDNSGTLNILHSLYPSENPSIILEKEKIEQQLALLNKPVVILIDDADRMERNELMELLRIIRVTANFKNIIFVVTYDKNYVIEMIETKGIKRGSEYLRKIFPLEISLPYTSGAMIPSLLIQEMRHQNFPDNFIEEVWKQMQVVKYGIGPEHFITVFLKNFRDVKNFVNILIMASDLIKESSIENEISYKDLFWIEIIRTYRYDVYEILRVNPIRILDKQKSRSNSGWLYTYIDSFSIQTSSDSEEKKKREQFKQDQDAEVELVLHILFGPQSKNKTSIRRLNNYQKYFSYRMPSNIVSNQDFEDLMNMEDEEKVCEQIQEIYKARKLNSLYNHLLLFNIEGCEEEQEAKNFLTAVIELVDISPDFETEKILKNSLDIHKCKQPIKSFVYDLLKSKIENKNCHYSKWNKVLAVLYSKTIFYEDEMQSESKYESIILDKEIQDIANMNCKNYLLSMERIPSIYSITQDGSMLNIFIKDACIVESQLLESAIEFRKNLILPTLQDIYSKKPNKKYKEKFMSPFEIDEEELIKNSSISEFIQNIKESIFGTIEDYDEFVKNVFP